MKTTTNQDITLRDCFALSALNGLSSVEDLTDTIMAEHAYAIADAMLEARKPKPTLADPPHPRTVEVSIYNDPSKFGELVGSVKMEHYCKGAEPIIHKTRLEPDKVKYLSDFEYFCERQAIKHWQALWKEANHD